MTVLSVGIMAVLTGVLSALNLQKDAALRYRAGLILQETLAETALTEYDGQPRQGLSSDGVFSWSVGGEPWVGAPRIAPPRREAKTEADKEHVEARALVSNVLQVRVDVSWETSKGSRRVTATQLVHVRLAEETP